MGARRVLVLGAGIAGVATAWYLAEGGAEVTVLDRADEVAAATSRANGGHLSTDSATPWTSPAAVREFLASRFARERAVRVLRAHDPGRWRWFAQALAAAPRHARAEEAMRRLARLSRTELERLLSELDIEVAFEARGVLGVYRTRHAFRRARRRLHAHAGLRWLSREEALVEEPALAQATAPLAGAVLYPGDATGDCRQFCLALARRAADAGVRIGLRTEIHGLALDAGRVRGVATANGVLEADDCVVALGPEAATFVQPYGLRLPLLPLRGYTLSAGIARRSAAPGRFVDAERRVVFARLGPVFRAAGMADFAGLDDTAPPARRAQLERTARDWYPALAGAAVEHWTCLRPMTPDGPPLLGATPIEGLWLNVGLGALGWTLGCGAGKVVADRILGRTPPLADADFGLERFRRGAQTGPLVRRSFASRGRR